MDSITEPHQPHFRVEFCLFAPDEDYEPSDHYLRFSTRESAQHCYEHPPTHIGDKHLNYNTIQLIHVEYDDVDQDSWFITAVESRRILHLHDRFENEYQDWE